MFSEWHTSWKLAVLCKECKQKQRRKNVNFLMSCFKTVDILMKMKKAENYGKFFSLLLGCCCKRWEKVNKTKY